MTRKAFTSRATVRFDDSTAKYLESIKEPGEDMAGVIRRVLKQVQLGLKEERSIASSLKELSTKLDDFQSQERESITQPASGEPFVFGKEEQLIGALHLLSSRIDDQLKKLEELQKLGKEIDVVKDYIYKVIDAFNKLSSSLNRRCITVDVFEKKLANLEQAIQQKKSGFFSR